jgi:glutamyl-tRNA reductase
LVVATGAQNPTIDAAILNLKKPLLILDLSIPKNVHDNVLQNPNVTLIHMDNLSDMTDETLERRKQHIPAAEAIIEDMKLEFNNWMNARKFAPTIHALKAKMQEIKKHELSFQRKKMINFNEEQAEIISNRIIQKITNHFASHLKDEETSVDDSINMIEKIFLLGIKSNSKTNLFSNKFRMNLS